MLAQRDVDVGQHGFELVQVEALELERRRQHDLLVLQTERGVQERGRRGGTFIEIHSGKPPERLVRGES